MKTLEVNNIIKKFGKKEVLHNVSFSIEEGEILGFIGPNGAGKTTTIKVILGLQKLDNGTVIINGFDVKKDFEKAIERVGSIVENPDMYMYLSGRKNLELIKNLYDDVNDARIDEVVKLVGLEGRIKDKVNKYSLGMRQRLGLAAALLNKPNLLILDEPTNGLDPEGIKELRSLIQKLAKEEKMSVLISSHNLFELESFCTNVCIIQNGSIIQTSSVKDIKHEDGSAYLIKLNKTKGIEKIYKDAQIINENYIKQRLLEKDVPKVIDKLIENKYKIYEIKQVEETLEDVFLRKTGGNKID